MNKLDHDRAVLRRLASGGPAVASSDVSPLIRRGARVILLMLWILAVLAAAVSGWLLVNHARTHTESTTISLEQFARRTITLAAFVVDEYEEFLDPDVTITGLAPSDPRLGRARMVLVSWRAGASLFKPWTWVTRFDPGRMFKAVR